MAENTSIFVLEHTGRAIKVAVHVPVPTDVGFTGQTVRDAFKNATPAEDRISAVPYLTPEQLQPITDGDCIEAIRLWYVPVGLNADAEGIAAATVALTEFMHKTAAECQATLRERYFYYFAQATEEMRPYDPDKLNAASKEEVKPELPPELQ